MMRSAARITKPSPAHSGVDTGERSGPITYDEFASLIPDGQKADLIDGVIYMASPDNLANARLQGWLHRLLGEYVEIYSLGEVFFSRVAYQLNEKNAPEPDLSFVPTEWKASYRESRVEGPPALAIEVVSPDSVRRDYLLKRELYEKAGVLEYWIFDETEESATFLYRRGNRFVEGKPKKHLWQSKTLRGFTLDVRWLWMDPRPRIFSILRDHYYPKPGRA
jgi:Uma2 family endonuclease